MAQVCLAVLWQTAPGCTDTDVPRRMELADAGVQRSNCAHGPCDRMNAQTAAWGCLIHTAVLWRRIRHRGWARKNWSLATR